MLAALFYRYYGNDNYDVQELLMEIRILKDNLSKLNEKINEVEVVEGF